MSKKAMPGEYGQNSGRCNATTEWGAWEARERAPNGGPLFKFADE